MILNEDLIPNFAENYFLIEICFYFLRERNIMNKIVRNLVGTIMALWLFTGTVSAATEIHWWHAFKGRLGTLLAEQVD